MKKHDPHQLKSENRSAGSHMEGRKGISAVPPKPFSQNHSAHQEKPILGSPSIDNKTASVQRVKKTAGNISGGVDLQNTNQTLTVTDEGTKVDLFQETLGLPKGWKYTAKVTDSQTTNTLHKSQTAARITQGAGSQFQKDLLIKISEVQKALRTKWAALKNKKFGENEASDEAMTKSLAVFNSSLDAEQRKYISMYLTTRTLEVKQVSFNGGTTFMNKKLWNLPAAAPDLTSFAALASANAMNDAGYAKHDPAKLFVEVKDNADKVLKQEIQFGYEWNNYITKVEESGGTGDVYSGAIYDPTSPPELTTHPNDYSRAHHKADGLDSIGDLANASRTTDTTARPVKIDAITKITAEGARWDVVLNNASTIKNETKIYAETAAGKFRYLTFKQLWVCWQKPFNQQFGISNATLAAKLIASATVWPDSVTIQEKDTDAEVTGHKIKVN